MRTLLAFFILILIIGLSFFIGKSEINLDTMEFKIERPVTALLFFTTVIALIIEEKLIEYLF